MFWIPWDSRNDLKEYYFIICDYDTRYYIQMGKIPERNLQRLIDEIAMNGQTVIVVPKSRLDFRQKLEREKYRRYPPFGYEFYFNKLEYTLWEIKKIIEADDRKEFEAQSEQLPMTEKVSPVVLERENVEILPTGGLIKTGKPQSVNCVERRIPQYRSLSKEGVEDVAMLLRDEMGRRENMTDKEIIDFVNSTKMCRVGKNALATETAFFKMVDGLRHRSVWAKGSGDLMDKIAGEQGYI